MPNESTPSAADPAAAPAAGAPAAGAPAADPAKPAAGAPEKYDAFKAPDGAALPESINDAFSEAAREVNLPQGDAQKVLDKLVPALQAGGVKATEQARADMLSAAQADPEIGGDKFGENVAIARLAIETYFTPEFKKFLDATGLGNHPEMIRGLRKAGESLKPDGWVYGDTKPNSDTGARKLYPNSNMQA